jgi:hypothetical protein
MAASTNPTETQETNMEDEVNDLLVNALASEMKLLFEDLDPRECFAAIIVITSFIIQNQTPEQDREAITNGLCSLLRQTLGFEPIPSKAVN